MLIFTFTSNRSFVVHGSHPITIPRSQVPYDELRAAKLDHDAITLVLPMGERLAARLYSGVSGYGPYFQLRTVAASPALPGYLKIGKRVLVLLIKSPRGSYCFLEMDDIAS